MIDELNRYHNITKMLVYLNEKIIESFNFFIKIFTAIIGGYLWLSIQSNSQDLKRNIAIYIQLILIAVCALTLVRVWANLKSWWGFRKAESQLVGIDKVPYPKIPNSCLSEILMCLIIIIATIIAFLLINSIKSYPEVRF